MLRALLRMKGQAILNAIYDTSELTDMRSNVVYGSKFDKGATTWQSGYTAVLRELCEYAIAGDPALLNYVLQTIYATLLEGADKVEGDEVLGPVALDVLERFGLPKIDREMFERDYTPKLIAAAEARKLARGEMQLSPAAQAELEDQADEEPSGTRVHTPGSGGQA